MRRQAGLERIGGLSGFVVGVQYYDASVGSGESVGIDRDPYNEFDPNAVRVTCKNGRPVGHLTREWAAWLAPLIDSGKIFLKGRVLPEGDQWRFPVDIEVFHTASGRSLFKPSREDSPEAVVHNHLLDIYSKSAKYSPETLDGVLEFYAGMVCGDSLFPETKLVFHMLEHRVARGDVANVEDMEAFLAKVDTVFAELKFGRMSSSGSVATLPLFLEKGSGEARYVSGKKALEDGSLVVEEVGAGVVGKLRATNVGDRPVMLIGGEGVKGAKQDRVLNITVVVEAGETVVVPVSCVERGRWSYGGGKGDGKRFRSANFATSTLRSGLAEDVARNMAEGVRDFRGDQDMVWHCVANTARLSQIHSETENLNHLYSGLEEKLENTRSKLRPPKGALGVAVFRGGEVVSVDIFNHPSLLEEYWGNIVDGVAMDALVSDGGKVADGKGKKRGVSKAAAEKNVREFLSGTRAGVSTMEVSPSPKGRVVVSDADDFSATALFQEGEFAHFAAFSKVSVSRTHRG